MEGRLWDFLSAHSSQIWNRQQQAASVSARVLCVSLHPTTCASSYCLSECASAGRWIQEQSWDQKSTCLLKAVGVLNIILALHLRIGHGNYKSSGFAFLMNILVFFFFESWAWCKYFRISFQADSHTLILVCDYIIPFSLCVLSWADNENSQQTKVKFVIHSEIITMLRLY